MNKFNSHEMTKLWRLSLEELRELYSAQGTTPAIKARITRLLKEKTEPNPYPKSKAQTIAQGLNRFHGAVTLLEGHMKGLDREVVSFISTPSFPTYIQYDINHLTEALKNAKMSIQRMVEINTQINTTYRKKKGKQ